ncbi:PREDICTED: uncharacterized protein LOC106928620 [Poecilia mexicana]|nr:PREDICTED: uncharacterized protein LOC106928620 [Poecilia mexicana]
MEACMMKPEVKKKPKPPKPPPKPTEVKRNEAERDVKPAPLMPPRPKDAELIHTQYRMKKSAALNSEPNGNIQQQHTKLKPSETAAASPRLAEKEPKAAARPGEPRKTSRETDQPEAAADEADFKRSNQSGLTGMFRRSQKEKMPTFTSYATDDQEEKSDDVPIKHAPSNKPASREPSPEHSAEETSSEKEQLGDQSKERHNAEHKQEKGGLLAGMFRKTPKEKSSPTLKVSKAESDSEDVEKEEEEKTSEPSHEKGGFFSGILKKSTKPADETSAQENLSDHMDLSASSDSLSDTKEKGGIFSGIFRKSPKPAETDQSDLSKSNENLSENSNVKEKGNVFSGMFRRSPKPCEGSQLEEGDESLHGELSASSDSLTENKEKSSFFGLLRKNPKPAGEENLAAHRDVSGSSDSLSEAASKKEKGKLKKSSGDDSEIREDKKTQDDDPSSSEGPNENPVKENGRIFGGMFKKTPKAVQSEEDAVSDSDVSASTENLSYNKQEKGGGLFSGLLKKTPKGEKTETPDREAQRELTASCEDLAENNKEKNIFSNMFKKTPKPAAEGAKAQTEDLDTDRRLSASSENLTDPTGPKEKKGGLAGIFKRSSSFDNLLDEDKNIFSGVFKRSAKPAEEGSNATGENTTLFGSTEDLLEANPTKEKTGGLTGFFKRSPKPSPRSAATEDPLTKQLSASLDSLTEAGNDDRGAQRELSGSTDNLCDTAKEKKAGLSGMFRRTPRNTEQQEGEDVAPPAGRGLSRKRTIKKKRRVVSFRVKKTLPRTSAEKSSEIPVIEESVEMEELNTPQESTVVVEPVEMAAYPTEESLTQMEQENNELMEWWNSVKGWTEWSETSNFQEEDEQIAMEQAADRVYMAARVFVHLFNQRGASLQQRILELLSMADAADEFHKKTVTAAVGGGVASVAGSVATITGLILAPFTFGASIIVTAVGIGVATAGSITSATANITDTVHSNMDRKKVEKMIQGYQEEIEDIRKCMEFVQEGMNTLEEWDFEKYSESAAKKALNHNIKHVMKEGGRAGKALMINTDKLISTVQVLGAAGGAAKAVQAVSVTTGVMSALFLALDIFFLAKDSHKLHKGAKTKFAAKIRQVCKDLQEGLLELNKVKTQLQKTMDGIEVEEYEDIEEVEVEDEFESDPKKLAELEQEIDFMEEKLDKKEKEEEVEPKKSKETTALDIFKIKKEKKEEKSMKEKETEDEEEEEGEEEEPKKSKESMLDIFKIKKEKKEEKSVEKTGEMEEEKGDEEPKKIKESALGIFKIKKEKKEKSVEKTGELEEKMEDEEPKKSKESVLDIFKIKKKEEKSVKEHEVEEKEEEEEPKKSKESVLDILKMKKEKKEEKIEKEKDVEEKDKGEKISESKSEKKKKVNETSVKTEKDVLKEQFEKESKKEKETGNQTLPGKKPEKKPEKPKEEPNKTPEIKTKPKNQQKETTIHHAGEEKPQRRTETSRRHSSRGEKDGEKHETRERREERGSHHRDRESWRRRGEEETGRKDSHRSHRDEESLRERKMSHHVRENEERSSRVESARRRFERAAGDQQQEEEERRQRRRGSDREHEHSRKGSRSKYDAMRHDGLNI